MTPKSTSAEERAEKIVRELFSGQTFSNNDIRNLIAAQIEEAEREARIEEASSWAISSERSQRELKEKLDKAIIAIKEARHEAIRETVESAEKIVYKHSEGKWGASLIIEEIRALLGTEGK